MDPDVHCIGVSSRINNPQCQSQQLKYPRLAGVLAFMLPSDGLRGAGAEAITFGERKTTFLRAKVG